MQRLTAVALLPLGLWFAIGLLLLDDFTYTTVVAWVQRPSTGIMLVSTVVAVGYHSYLGVQVVIEDYVHGAAAKVAALIFSALAHFGLTVAALFAVLRVAFGSA
jgi:succinate dehydrogenase / fumarate reductase membrane anchor subunit